MLTTQLSVSCLAYLRRTVDTVPGSLMPDHVSPLLQTTQTQRLVGVCEVATVESESKAQTESGSGLGLAEGMFQQAADS